MKGKSAKHACRTALFILAIAVIAIIGWFFFSMASFSRNIGGTEDISRRLASPDFKRTALLTRRLGFDLDYALYVDDNYNAKPTSGTRIWSREFNPPNQSINHHEDLEWSKDSTVIAVLIDGRYQFAYDFVMGKYLEDGWQIQQLPNSRKQP